MIEYDLYNCAVELKTHRESLQIIDENAQKIISKSSYEKQTEIFIGLYRSLRLSYIHDIIEKIKYTNVTDSLASACLILFTGNVVTILLILSEYKK